MYNYLKIDLHFFEEKTEEPTQKRKTDARKKANVRQSRELTGSMVLIVGILSIKIFATKILNTLTSALYFFLEGKAQINTIKDGYLNILIAFAFVIKSVAYVLIPAAFTGFLVQRKQVGKLFTWYPVKPKLSGLNPIKGFKKFFSISALFNLFKSLLKLVCVGFVGFLYIKDNISLLLKSSNLPTVKAAHMFYYFSINLALRMAYTIILIGILDFFYQSYKYKKSMKMSKHEVKEEFKQSEGDPQIKAKIKEKQREMAMKRMMENLPNADVIITNPTHFAVALKYDEDKHDAPFVIAKGSDYVAQRIKEKGKELNIPIIENKPLARALYFKLDVGMEITEELYEAVAEVLAYVYSLKNKN